MRHADTYRGARKRQAKANKFPWSVVPPCRVTLMAPVVKDGRQVSSGKALKMKMIPTSIAQHAP